MSRNGGSSFVTWVTGEACWYCLTASDGVVALGEGGLMPVASVIATDNAQAVRRCGPVHVHQQREAGIRGEHHVRLNGRFRRERNGGKHHEQRQKRRSPGCFENGSGCHHAAPLEKVGDAGRVDRRRGTVLLQ